MPRPCSFIKIVDTRVTDYKQTTDRRQTTSYDKSRCNVPLKIDQEQLIKNKVTHFMVYSDWHRYWLGETAARHIASCNHLSVCLSVLLEPTVGWPQLTWLWPLLSPCQRLVGYFITVIISRYVANLLSIISSPSHPRPSSLAGVHCFRYMVHCVDWSISVMDTGSDVLATGRRGDWMYKLLIRSSWHHKHQVDSWKAVVSCAIK